MGNAESQRSLTPARMLERIQRNFAAELDIPDKFKQSASYI